MALGLSANVLGMGSSEQGSSPTFNIVTANGFLAGNGSAAAPSYSYTARQTDGYYSSAAGVLGFTGNGVAVGTWGNSTLTTYGKTLQGPTYLATTSAVGSAFTNQPSNDGVTVVSSNAADTTQVVTIIGTTTATNTVVTENITLTGTTGVPSVKTNWGQVLAVKISASCAGTMTVKKTTGLSTIVAITTGNLSAGVNTVSAANQFAYNQTLSTVASGATTKQVGWKGTDNTNAVIYDSNALNGTMAVASNSSFLTLTEIYTGDVEATRTVTVTTNGSFTIQAGNIALTATGTNQSITLTPSGTGLVQIGAGQASSTGLLDVHVTTDRNFRVRQNTDLSLESVNDAGNAFVPLNFEGSVFTFGRSSTGHLLLGGLTTDGTGVLQFPTGTTAAGGITLGNVNLFQAASGKAGLGSGQTFLVDTVQSTGQGSFVSLGGSNISVNANGGSATMAAGTNAIIQTNGVTALTLDSSQNATFAGTIIGGGSQALSGAGAVDVTHLITNFTSTGGAQALTLANGTDGQIKIICHVVDGGSGVLTPTTKTGYTTITFTNAGDSVTLKYTTTTGWFIVGIFGAVAA